MSEGEFKKKLIGSGSGSLTSSEIAFNLMSSYKYPEWAKKGTMTRNYQLVRWAREEYIQEVIDEAKKEFPIIVKYLTEENGYSSEWENNIPKEAKKIVIVPQKALEWFVKWFGSEKEVRK